MQDPSPPPASPGVPPAPPYSDEIIKRRLDACPKLASLQTINRALRALMKNQVKLGANAGLTVIVVGTAAEASATTNANVDVIAWSPAQGASAGQTLAGSMIKPNTKAIKAFYGRNLLAEDILLHDAGTPRFDDGRPLRMALSDSEIRSGGRGR